LSQTGERTRALCYTARGFCIDTPARARVKLGRVRLPRHPSEIAASLLRLSSIIGLIAMQLGAFE
jgi:hypothetical protein